MWDVHSSMVCTRPVNTPRTVSTNVQSTSITTHLPGILSRSKIASFFSETPCRIYPRQNHPQERSSYRTCTKIARVGRFQRSRQKWGPEKAAKVGTKPTKLARSTQASKGAVTRQPELRDSANPKPETVEKSTDSEPRPALRVRIPTNPAKKRGGSSPPNCPGASHASIAVLWCLRRNASAI